MDLGETQNLEGNQGESVKDTNSIALSSLSEMTGFPVDFIKKELLLQNEETNISAFVAENPSAREHKEALKDLGRKHPSMSYQDLYAWKFGSKPGKSTQVETGDGSQDRAGKINDDKAFNKLTLSERRSKLSKMYPGEINI